MAKSQYLLFERGVCLVKIYFGAETSKEIIPIHGSLNLHLRIDDLCALAYRNGSKLKRSLLSFLSFHAGFWREMSLTDTLSYHYSDI